MSKCWDGNCKYACSLNTVTGIMKCKEKGEKIPLENGCEDYIETIDIEEENIEERHEVNITTNCPNCGEESTEYNIAYEENYTIECECGYSYCFSYCPY